MPDHRDIRAYCKGVLEAIAGANKVIDHFVRLQSAEDYVANFGAGTKAPDGSTIFKGWEILVVRAGGNEIASAGGYYADYVARCRRYESIHDGGATELDFWDHIEAAKKAFDANTKPVELGGELYHVGPAEITSADELNYAGVLCHHGIVDVPIIYSR